MGKGMWVLWRLQLSPGSTMLLLHLRVSSCAQYLPYCPCTPGSPAAPRIYHIAPAPRVSSCTQDLSYCPCTSESPAVPRIYHIVPASQGAASQKVLALTGWETSRKRAASMRALISLCKLVIYLPPRMRLQWGGLLVTTASQEQWPGWLHRLWVGSVSLWKMK